MILFGKEDIEKMGLKYEPDIAKCQVGKTKVYYGSINVSGDGKVRERNTIMTSDEYNPKEYKMMVGQSCPFAFVHSFEIPDDLPDKDGHWDVWVCVRGHTRKADSEDEMKVHVRDEALVQKVREFINTWVTSRENVFGGNEDSIRLVKEIMEEMFLRGYEAGKSKK
jgi:hypothetical protein